MIYGNSKNTTFTHSTANCTAAVGFFLAMILRSFYPTALDTDWYWYLFGAILFSLPGLLSSYKQFKSGYSLKQIELTKRPFRIWD